MKASRLLAAYLTKNGITPAAFAEKIGANRSQVYRLLTRERGPSGELATAIEAATEGAVPVASWWPAKPTRSRAA